MNDTKIVPVHPGTNIPMHMFVRASDVATVLGLNPYKSPFELWGEMTGRVKREEYLDPMHPTQVGKLMEEPIARLYEARTGRKVVMAPETQTCSAYPWLSGHIDRRVRDSDRGLEIKNVGYHAARGWGQDGEKVADHYVPQVMTYLMLMPDIEVFDVAAYFGGNDLRLYELAPDKEWEEIIAGSTHDFLVKHVLKDEPPSVEGVPADVVRRVYTGTDGSILDATVEIERWRDTYDEASAIAAQYAQVADGAKAHMLRFLGEGAVLRFSDGTQLSRKWVERKGYEVKPSRYLDARFGKQK